MASFAFGIGWVFVGFLTLYPASLADSDLRLLSEAAWVDPCRDSNARPTTPSPRHVAAERLVAKYPDLHPVPAEDRGRVIYYKIMADQAARTQWGILGGLFFAVGISVGVSVAETLAAGILLRRLGRVRRHLALPGARRPRRAPDHGAGKWRRQALGGWFAGHPAQLLLFNIIHRLPRLGRRRRPARVALAPPRLAPRYLAGEHVRVVGDRTRRFKQYYG